MTTAKDQSQIPWKIGVSVTLAAAIVPALLSNLDKIAPLFQSSANSSPVATISPANSPVSGSSNQTSFYVIAAESKFPDSLRQVPAQAAGLEFPRSFPNIKICPSKVDTEKYYLVLGSKLSQSEAKDLRQQAIVNNFQNDTYIQSEKQIFFVPSNCSPVVTAQGDSVF